MGRVATRLSLVEVVKRRDIPTTGRASWHTILEPKFENKNWSIVEQIIKVTVVENFQRYFTRYSMNSDEEFEIYILDHN